MMYRKGLEPEQIARLCHTTPATVRRYLDAAMEADPLLWEKRLKPHAEPSLPRHVRGTSGAEWRRWHGMLAGFVQGHGRLPALADGATAAGALELALHLWLREQRAAHRRGRLNLTQLTHMARIPGWRRPPEHSKEAVRWNGRLAQCAAFLQEHGTLPNPSKPATDHELVLGRWLALQRRKKQGGLIDPLRARQLDATVPRWAEKRKAGALRL